MISSFLFWVIDNLVGIAQIIQRPVASSFTDSLGVERTLNFCPLLEEHAAADLDRQSQLGEMRDEALKKNKELALGRRAEIVQHAKA